MKKIMEIIKSKKQAILSGCAILGIFCVYQNCGKNNETISAAQAVQTAPPANNNIKPANGNYKTLGVGCYDATLTNVISSAVFSNASPTEITTISNNNYNVTDTAANCSVIENGVLIYGAQTPYGGNGGTGNVTFDPSQINVTGNSPCAINFVLNLVSGSPMTMMSFGSSVTPNQNPPSYSVTVIYDPTSMLMYSTLKAVNDPASHCFLVYQKL